MRHVGLCVHQDGPITVVGLLQNLHSEGGEREREGGRECKRERGGRREGGSERMMRWSTALRKRGREAKDLE